MLAQATDLAKTTTGTLAAAHGVVLDVDFPDAQLPPIRNAQWSSGRRCHPSHAGGPASGNGHLAWATPCPGRVLLPARRRARVEERIPGRPRLDGLLVVDRGLGLRRICGQRRVRHARDPASGSVPARLHPHIPELGHCAVAAHRAVEYGFGKRSFARRAESGSSAAITDPTLASRGCCTALSNGSGCEPRPGWTAGNRLTRRRRTSRHRWHAASRTVNGLKVGLAVAMM
jgi:hypothetical protein